MFTLCIYTYMGVSKNRGTPKSSISIGFSIVNHFGVPVFLETPIYTTNLEGHAHKLRKNHSKLSKPSIVQKQIHSSPFFLLPKHFFFLLLWLLLWLLFPPCSSQQQKICWFFGGCICESLEKKRESVFAAWLRTSPWSPVAWLQKKTQEVQLPEAIGGGGWWGIFFSSPEKRGRVLGGCFFFTFFWWMDFWGDLGD